MPLIQLQVKLEKTAEITYLDGNKQQARYRLTYLKILNKEERYYCCFEGQRTGGKVNVTFLAVINKKVRSAVCI